MQKMTHLNLGIQKAILSEVCNSTHKVEHPVSHGDDSVRGECDRLGWNSPIFSNNLLRFS